MPGLKRLIIVLSCFLSVLSLKEEISEESVTIQVQNLFEEFTGNKGTIKVLMHSNPNFDIIDTSKNIYFKTKITNEQSSSYLVDCGFWKAKEEDLYIYCNIGENIPSGKYSLNLKEVSTITYKNYSPNLL